MADELARRATGSEIPEPTSPQRSDPGDPQSPPGPDPGRRTPGSGEPPDSASVRRLPSAEGRELAFALVLVQPSEHETTGGPGTDRPRCHGRLLGEIDYYANLCLREVLGHLGASGAWVHLDLSGVTFIDAGGTALLVDLRQRVQDAGGELVLDAVTPGTERLLRLLRHEELLDRPTPSSPGQDRDPGR